MILLHPSVERQITADVAERRYFHVYHLLETTIEQPSTPENFTDRAIKKEKKKKEKERFQRKFRKFQISKL